MTWLSEIEKTNKTSREYHEMTERKKIPERPMERMARVIRNMVAYIIHESDTLSEDVMEIINEE